MDDALVIENLGSSRNIDEDAHARTDHECFGMIHLNPLAADNFDDVRLERRLTLESADRRLETLGAHDRIILWFRALA